MLGETGEKRENETARSRLEGEMMLRERRHQIRNFAEATKRGGLHS